MRMEIVTVRMPRWLLEVIDVVRDKAGYENRSEFVRDAVIQFLRALLRSDGEVAKEVRMRMPYVYARLKGDGDVV